MGKIPEWRRIERELEDIARRNGFDLDESSSGDKLVIVEGNISITEMAKDLAERLK